MLKTLFNTGIEFQNTQNSYKKRGHIIPVRYAYFAMATYFMNDSIASKDDPLLTKFNELES